MGAMVGPEAFTELRFLQQRKMHRALDVIEKVTAEYRALTGRNSGGLLDCYRCDDAELKLIVMGSSVGTAKDEIDRLRAEGVKVGLISLKSFRPFPYAKIKEAIGDCKKVVCLERTFSYGARGVVCPEVKRAMEGTDTDVRTVIAGLGGRAIYGSTIRKIVEASLGGKLTDEMTFIDLDPKVLNSYLKDTEGVTVPEDKLVDETALEATLSRA